MEQLIKFIEQRFRMCQNGSGHEAKKNFLHQAFGAIEFYSYTNPGNGEALAVLWEEWREKFIHEIWDQGLTNKPSRGIIQMSRGRTPPKPERK